MRAPTSPRTVTAVFGPTATSTALPSRSSADPSRTRGDPVSRSVAAPSQTAVSPDAVVPETVASTSPVKTAPVAVPARSSVISARSESTSMR